MKLKKILTQFPNFHQWVKDRKLDPGHLSLLTEFSDIQKLQPLLTWINKNNPTHSKGLQILEMAGELLLMGTSLDTIFDAAQNPEELLKQLKKLRYPLTSKQEEQKTKRVQNLPWPRQMKGRWIRQNDKTGLEIQFQCFSMKEFKQKIQNLQHIADQMEEEEPDLWNS
ncbi:MAG: hypothetical protein OXB86_03210 [Bdellovibrionales bacterium]|nr:hypothetical protein [Bdellovibrionales bacterium]